MNGLQMGGLIIRYKKGHYFRMWRYGYEWGHPGGGRMNFWPWTRQYREMKKRLKQEF